MRSLSGDFRNWWYDVADFFFPKAMDTAYDQGIRIGAEYAARMISMEITQAGEKSDLTKAQAVGYDLAKDAVVIAKRKITAKTGAML